MKRDRLIDVLEEIKGDYINTLESIKEDGPEGNEKYLKLSDRIDNIMDIQDELRTLNIIEKAVKRG